MNPNNLLLTTDFPFDMGGYVQEFTYTIPNSPDFSSASYLPIPHGLNFSPLCTGIFTDDDWNTSFDFGSSPMFSNPNFGGQWGQRLVSTVESDINNVYINVFNGDTSRQMKFRIIGFPPSDFTGEAISTNATGINGFILNSDRNYMKLLDADKVTANPPNTGVPLIVPINHGLNYVPHALIWTTIGGLTRQAGLENYIGVGGIDVEPILKTQVINVSLSAFITTSVDVHWRIYLDD